MKPAVRDVPELLLGFGIIFAGLVVAYQASIMQAGPLYARVGPAAFPWAVSALLLMCGAALAFRALKVAAEEQEKLEFGGPAAIIGGLLLQALLLEGAGFMPAAALLFFLTAYGFGSRRYLRDALAAISLAVTSFVIFRYGLGLALPTGSWFA